MTLIERKQKNGKSLFNKITGNIVLLILSLFTLAAICIGFLVYQTTDDLIMNNLSSNATSYAKIVEKDLQILQVRLESLAQYAVGLGSDLSSTQVNDQLDKRKGEFGYTTIYGIDKNGKTSIPGITVETRDYFQASIAGNFFTSSPFLKSDNTVGITVSVPAMRNNSIDGIISCGLPYDYFCDFVKFSSNQGTSAYIINKQGTIVAHTNPDLVMQLFNSIENAKTDATFQEQADVITAFLNGDRDVHAYTTSSGTVNIGIARDIPGTDGWLIITTVPQAQVTSSVVSVLLVMLVIVLLGAIIGIIAARSLAKGIAKPVQDASRRMQLLAAGDLSTQVVIANTGDEIQQLTESIRDTIDQMRSYIVEISTVVGQMSNYNLNVAMTGEFKGEFEPIKTALNSIISVLARSFVDINHAAQQVGSGSSQVADGAQMLAQGSVEQSSAIEQLSATVSEISQQISATANNAATANDRSNQVGHSIGESDQRMQELLVAMREINASSGEIGKIIKTIEDIAFQTNILALNAAVEAARAGAAGKGFAVVADEVRNLANKSSVAAKGTTQLIEKSLQNVNRGTTLAQNAAGSMNEVVESVREVVASIAQISEASATQAISIRQIATGVDQISAVVQTNSATAEQSSAASEELSSQADLLKDLVGKFQIADKAHAINRMR